MTTALWASLSDEADVIRYRFSTGRAARPADTLRRIGPLLPKAGITRLADVTALDVIGVPVYQAVRPNSRNLSVSQGKGLTQDQAKVSALMESLESFHAEEIRQPVVRETVGTMRRTLAYDPYALELHERSLLNDATLLDWIAATELTTGAETWVPRRLCELDFSTPTNHEAPLFAPSSNGLASGNTVAEAMVHGLLEVVERDSEWRSYQARPTDRPSVALTTVFPRLARGIIGRLAALGIQVRIVDMSGPAGLPCFEAFLEDPESPYRPGGSGCHLSRLTALMRALTEAVQSRLTMIAGSRDDISRRAYRTVTVRHQRQPSRETTSFRSTPSVPLTGFAAQVREIVGRITSLTGMAPLAIDLRRPDFDLPVVFVVAPGLRMRGE
jgi:YcaO-like protein with predicted kinase domain